MRVVVIILLLANVYPVMAITRCEYKGKVTFKNGSCPERATAKYLVRGRYVGKKVLQDKAQEREGQSRKVDKALDKREQQPGASYWHY